MTSTIKLNLKSLANEQEKKNSNRKRCYIIYLNTAAILPGEERCVCKCHGSESVCETPWHLSYTFFFPVDLKVFQRADEAEFVFSLDFVWFLCSSAFVLQCRWRLSGERSKVRAVWKEGWLELEWCNEGTRVQPGHGSRGAEVVEGWLKTRRSLTPLLVREWQGSSVTVGLVGVLGALLGWWWVSHGALGLSGTLDIALVTKAGARVLKEREKWRRSR